MCRKAAICSLLPNFKSKNTTNNFALLPSFLLATALLSSSELIPPPLQAHYPQAGPVAFFV